MKYKTRFFLFFIAMSLFHLSANFVHPVTPTLIKNLNQPEYMFGLMFAVMTITNFALSPFWGKINLYISSRLSLLICCVSYALCQLGFAYSVNQLQLLTVRALAGIFIGGITVSLLTYVVNAAKPEDQGKYLIYTATNQSVVAAFGYLVGGMVGEYSILLTFWLQAIILCIAGVLFRFGCASDKCIDEKISMKQLARDANPLQAFFEGKYFMTAAFVMLFVINALINLGNTGFDQAFNYYLKDQLNLTSSYNGIIKAVVGFVSFVANMSLCLWIIRKTNVKKSMVVLLLGCTAVSVATVLPLSLRLFMVFGVLVYTGYSVIVPVLQDMVANLSDPAQKNLVMGFFNATRSIGSIIGALAAGFIYGIHAKLPFLCVALSYGLSILVAVLFLTHRRKQ